MQERLHHPLQAEVQLSVMLEQHTLGTTTSTSGQAGGEVAAYQGLNWYYF